MTDRLILASASRFRRQLMENAGLSFHCQAASVDERAIEASLDVVDAGQVALALARAKALDVSRHHPAALVVGSDQTMSLGKRIYHKPADLDEARDNLLSLSGKTHRLNSGVVIARGDQVLWEQLAHADLTMRPFDAGFVDRYLARVGDTVKSSVGGYQLEGEGIQLFSAIDGDYFTIIGLPMLPLLEALRQLGAIDV